MYTDNTTYDAVIIGGGFYGAAIAIYLAKQRGLKRIMVIDKEGALLTRASYNNQARVHNGYHYPRSFTTAYRSRINLPRFIQDWPEAVTKDFTKLYAIARRGSKVTAKQFERFCKEIGAKIQDADTATQALFNPHLIEKAFLVEEYAFDSSILARWAKEELDELGIALKLNTLVSKISRNSDKTLSVSLNSKGLNDEALSSRYIFNCTYSGLNHFNGHFPGTQMNLKHEITEMALMKMPTLLQRVGVTVMDGPFFSFMPFPARGLHTLSHVRYTPHLNWFDKKGVNPYAKLAAYKRDSRVERMIRDVSRYVPAIQNAIYKDSLFEVKTVLAKNEADDGRPILFEKHAELPGCYSILGGKIDNIYDVLEKLEDEYFN